jgi:hypothetical protein
MNEFYKIPKHLQDKLTNEEWKELLDDFTEKFGEIKQVNNKRYKEFELLDDIQESFSKLEELSVYVIKFVILKKQLKRYFDILEDKEWWRSDFDREEIEILKGIILSIVNEND